jgi:hypothetical protein
MKTSDINLGGLVERVTKLERQNRFWKVGGTLAALLFVFSLAVGVRAQQAVPYRPAPMPSVPNAEQSAKSIEAQAFVLTDADGNKRGVLTVTKGIPKLELYGVDGRVTWSTNGQSKLVSSDRQ